MATIGTIKFWNTTPHDRYEIVNVNIPLPQGMFMTASELTSIAAQDPVGDGSNYVLQSKPFGARFPDGSIKRITAWFAVRISAGVTNGSAPRGTDRFPYLYLREKQINIINTGGVTISWAPHARYLTSNNPYGLLDANYNIDQTTTTLMTMSYSGKELYYNYSDAPTLKTFTFKPLQSNIDGTLSNAEELDTDTVGSTFTRSWRTKIRYYPENNGGTVREPTMWVWFIIDIPTFGMMSRFWLQYGFGEIRPDNDRRNEGNDSFILTRDIKLVTNGPDLQWIFESHKIPAVSKSSSSQNTNTTTTLIAGSQFTQQQHVTSIGAGSGASATTVFTFPQPHGITVGADVGLVDWIQGNAYDRHQDIAVANSSTQITSTGKNKTLTDASVTAVQDRAVLFHNTMSQCITGFLILYNDVLNINIYDYPNEVEHLKTILAMFFEAGDHPLLWSSMNWPDYNSYCAFGIVKSFPAHYASEQTAREDATIIAANQFNGRRNTRDPWQNEINGAAPRTGIAGGQAEFGSSKGGHLARAAIPDMRTFMMDLLQEACRAHHYREPDTTILNGRNPQYRTNPNVYSDVVFDSGRSHLTAGTSSWQNKLGENAARFGLGAGANAAGGWYTIQNLHWAWNGIAAANHFVADRWFRHAEIYDSLNVWLLGKPVPTPDITRQFVSSVWGPTGADRSEYRYVLTACQLYEVSGNTDIIQRLADRADYNLGWAINVADSVYNPDRVSMIVFGAAGNWNTPTTARSAICWMGNMVHHLYAAVKILTDYGDQTSADKYAKLLTRIGRSNTLAFMRKNSQTNNVWTTHYYADYDWDPQITGRMNDPNIYPGCWLAESGTSGLSQVNPLTGRRFNKLYTGGLNIWGWGTQILLWELMGTDSTLMERVYDMLNGPGRVLALPNSQERSGYGGWGKTWTDNYDDWVTVIQDPYKSRSLSGTTVTPATLISAWPVFDASASQNVSPSLLLSTFEIFTPTFGEGVTVAPAVLVEAFTVFDAFVNTDIEQTVVNLFTIFEPTLGSGITYTPDPIVEPFTIFDTDSGMSVEAGTVVEVDGQTTVDPTQIVEEFEIFNHDVGIGVDNQPDLISITVTIFAPRIDTVGAGYISLTGIYDVESNATGTYDTAP